MIVEKTNRFFLQGYFLHLMQFCRGLNSTYWKLNAMNPPKVALPSVLVELGDFFETAMEKDDLVLSEEVYRILLFLTIIARKNTVNFTKKHKSS